MAAIGMGLMWAGYFLGFWGYTLVKGYDIPVGTIAKPGSYTGSWPPPLYKDGAANVGGPIGGGLAAIPPSALTASEET